ncbi:MAG: exosortase system-associated protein, TIGR04073 family [Methyloprofundus sp.]|nr:exosortase system-associated protein, TIGR04073 family [Methyloprofundus sp.]
MKFNKTLLLTLLGSIFLCFSSLSLAEVQSTEAYPAQTYPTKAPQKASYGRKIGQKALWGLSNATLSFFEIPKNMIMVTNKSNLLYGLTAGLGLGLLNTAGRTLVGINDLVFFLLPTKPVVYPIHPWQDYLEVETNYEDIFILD